MAIPYATNPYPHQVPAELSFWWQRRFLKSIAHMGGVPH